jgi:ferredoxin-thioredoxin reductase catalytic subunit
MYLPFHAAEQYVNRRQYRMPTNKERISDSAERMRLSDVARSLWTAQGSPPLADQVNGCPFGFILGKQNEHKKYLSPCYQHSIAGTHQISWWIQSDI